MIDQNLCPSRQRPSTVVGPIVATLLFHALMVGLYVAAFHGDVSSLVCADQERVGKAPFEAIHVGFPARGFDGQYFYLIAQAPWTRQGEFVDPPAYRHVRLLFPALAWLFTSGDPNWLLWILPAINLAAIGGIAWIGACLARHYGLSTWWGFLLPIVVNAGSPALRDLADPLALCAVCGLLAAWLMGSSLWALVLWAAAAAFSREQNVAVILILLAAGVATRRWQASAWLALVLLVWAGWVGLLRVEYGAWPFLPDTLGAPFSGMIYRWTHLAGMAGPRSAAVHVFFMFLLMLQLGLAFYLATWPIDPTVKVLMLAGTALAILGGTAIYLTGWSYMRVFCFMPLGIWLACMQAHRFRPVLLLTPAILLPVIAVVQVWQM